MNVCIKNFYDRIKNRESYKKETLHLLWQGNECVIARLQSESCRGCTGKLKRAVHLCMLVVQGMRSALLYLLQLKRVSTVFVLQDIVYYLQGMFHSSILISGNCLSLHQQRNSLGNSPGFLRQCSPGNSLNCSCYCSCCCCSCWCCTVGHNWRPCCAVLLSC